MPVRFAESSVGVRATCSKRNSMVTGLVEGLRRLSLGLFLLGLGAVILLLSDLNSRVRPLEGDSEKDGLGRRRRVALVQHASIKAIEDGRLGFLEQLKKRGFENGVNIDLKSFNAEADIATANAIAKEVTGGDYDLIVSISTVSLQTIANANKTGRRTPHVFGLVTDPFGAGVGIDANDHLKHPPYMTGYGCMQPVDDIIRIMVQMRPGLKRIGLVWNPAEAKSMAQTRLAREVCKSLSIELIEGNADNSSSVQEVANSVIARGAEAIWISGDITVSLAATAVLSAAQKGRIPVFSSLPPLVTKGSLLDLGSDYIQIGRDLGDLTADVLEGQDPASIPVENRVQVVMLYNETVIEKLKDRWVITPEIRRNAAGFINATQTDLPEGFQEY